MKQLILTNGKILVEDFQPPVMNSDEILIATACSIVSSGTEGAAVKSSSRGMVSRLLHDPSLAGKALSRIRNQGVARTFHSVREKISHPARLGYSSAGVVLAVGKNIVDISPGQRVACGGSQAAHAEIVSVPRNLVARVPDAVRLEEAAFTTLGTIALHAVRRANLQVGETIVILGLGLLGLLGAQIAKAAGLQVVGIDINDKRIKLARDLGIDLVLHSGRDPVLKEVRDFSEHYGADAVIVFAASDSSAPVNLAFDLCRIKGRVVGVGSFRMDLDRNKMYEKELDFIMSTSYGPGRYDPVYEESGIDYPIGYVRWTENRNMTSFLRLLAEKKIDVDRMIERQFPIERAQEAYDALSTGNQEKPLAILLQYRTPPFPGTLPPPPQESKVSMPVSLKKENEPFNVALIGAGNFAREYLLPAIRNFKADFYLKRIASARGDNAGRIQQAFGSAQAGTFQEILEDNSVDMVLICTRHHLHYSMVLEAFAHGKAVFVEKPLCMNREELSQIAEEAEKRGLPLVVGFNRRYAPLSRQLKKYLQRLKEPFLITYRVNAGFIPGDHWIQDPAIGGGRILGEACHFFDYFNFLTGNTGVRDVQVSAIPVNGTGTVAHDNVAVTIQYETGSTAVLVYTALGQAGMEKERIEVFADGTCFVLNDFRTLEVFGIPIDSQDIAPGIKKRGHALVLSNQDKGIQGELEAIAGALRGRSTDLIRLSEIVSAMEMTFEVAERTRRAKGLTVA